MPIRYSEDPAQHESIREASEKFLIFFSSRNEEGKLWCPDCRDVEQLIEQTFGGSDSPSALLVWVGQKDVWRAPTNPIHHDPFQVRAIPTIIRVHDGAKLVESEITADSISTFITE